MNLEPGDSSARLRRSPKRQTGAPVSGRRSLVAGSVDVSRLRPLPARGGGGSGDSSPAWPTGCGVRGLGGGLRRPRSTPSAPLLLPSGERDAHLQRIAASSPDDDTGFGASLWIASGPVAGGSGHFKVATARRWGPKRSLKQAKWACLSHETAPARTEATPPTNPLFEKETNGVQAEPPVIFNILPAQLGISWILVPCSVVLPLVTLDFDDWMDITD